eukprot:CAMPEP_0175981734 /NCGR_PEP_ID=MMETSP0108-20121206/47504_1 /TAXON_ID=195067 ORGANISM="Goniomonas pacifica, Strain CCMP1869" /NCGR_SAMPLE_ID=MMETSP0108 /ASSEMBLY_ACC=CAM_ASM_000204 /LENGTH=54 /DNA_ID=CAMNT_0017312305 /DNA_START=58 /DNA_END=218 /DNA_ORIENTATION=-
MNLHVGLPVIKLIVEVAPSELDLRGRSAHSRFRHDETAQQARREQPCEPALHGG